MIDTTEILADLICAKMLGSIDRVEDYANRWSWPDRPIRVRWSTHDACVVYLHSNDQKIKISDRAEKKLAKTIRTVLDIREKQRKADEHTANQMAALDAIELIVA